MNNSTPQIQASTFKDAQDYIHDWKLSQWRMTSYLEAMDVLPKQGIMPTDTSIARHMSATRAPGGVQTSMQSLHFSGLVDIVSETTLGRAYKLTNKGELAVVQFRQVVAKWKKLHATNAPTPEPNYAKSFERLNHEIKVQRQTIDSQAQTITYQNEVIAALRKELATFKSPEPVKSKVVPQAGRKSYEEDSPFDF